MRLLRHLFFLVTAAAGSAALAQSSTPAPWTSPVEPFRIAGNLYYVGTAGLPSYLIADPAGHVLIDGTMEQNVPSIAASIAKLGFSMRDVRYLLINHAHWDHAAGLAELKRLSGARLIASAGDRPELEAGRTAWRPDLAPFPAVAVDQEIVDGETLKIGSTTLVAHLTAGHTPGCTSWATSVVEQGRRLEVLFACSLTVAGQKLVGDKGYPRAAADFEKSFDKLRRVKADIFLNFHTEMFDFDSKRTRLQAGDAFAFVDRAELQAQVDKSEKVFRKELAAQRGE